MEHGPVEIVDFPMNSMVDLSSSLCKRLPGRVPHMASGNLALDKVSHLALDHG